MFTQADVAFLRISGEVMILHDCMIEDEGWPNILLSEKALIFDVERHIPLDVLYISCINMAIYVETNIHDLTPSLWKICVVSLFLLLVEVVAS